jgi:hypothetical protein
MSNSKREIEKEKIDKAEWRRIHPKSLSNQEEHPTIYKLLTNEYKSMMIPHYIHIDVQMKISRIELSKNETSELKRRTKNERNRLHIHINDYMMSHGHCDPRRHDMKNFSKIKYKKINVDDGNWALKDHTKMMKVFTQKSNQIKTLIKNSVTTCHHELWELSQLNLGELRKVCLGIMDGNTYVKLVIMAKSEHECLMIDKYPEINEESNKIKIKVKLENH